MDVLRTARTRVSARMARLAAAREREAQRGQTLAEHSLLMGVIAVGAITALTALGAITTGMFWEPINRVFQEVLDLFTP